jgi:hypothetical protein
MTYRTIFTEVEVDVDLSEFTTEELQQELVSRDKSHLSDVKLLVEDIYQTRRNGNDYTQLLDKLIYNVIGRF